VIEKDEMLDRMNQTPGGGGGGTDKLETGLVRSKLEKYWGQHSQTKPNESVDRMKARNSAIRLSKKLPVRSEEAEIKAETKVEPTVFAGHTVFAAGGECEIAGCPGPAGFLCFKRRIILCKMHTEGHLEHGCEEKKAPAKKARRTNGKRDRILKQILE